MSEYIPDEFPKLDTKAQRPGSVDHARSLDKVGLNTCLVTLRGKLHCGRRMEDRFMLQDMASGVRHLVQRGIHTMPSKVRAIIKPKYCRNEHSFHYNGMKTGERI